MFAEPSYIKTLNTNIILSISTNIKSAIHVVYSAENPQNRPVGLKV